jgi:hypothetical protein
MNLSRVRVAPWLRRPDGAAVTAPAGTRPTPQEVPIVSRILTGREATDA